MHSVKDHFVFRLELQLVRKWPSFKTVVLLVWLLDKIAPQRHHKTDSQLFQLHFQLVKDKLLFPIYLILLHSLTRDMTH